MLKYESTSGYAMLQVSGSGLEVLTDVAILINQVYVNTCKKYGQATGDSFRAHLVRLLTDPKSNLWQLKPTTQIEVKATIIEKMMRAMFDAEN